jgi:hypothetical protein
VTISDIARQTDHDRKTIRSAVQKPLLAMSKSQQPKVRKLEPYIPYLEQRMNEGVYNAQKFYQELREQGYGGKDRQVRAFVKPYRAARHQQATVIQCDPGRTLTHVYAALDLLTGKATVLRTQTMKGEVSVLFLQKRFVAYPDQPILLQWDRATWHQGPAVKDLLAANPRLEIFFFPPGSPDLNPQEHV